MNCISIAVVPSGTDAAIKRVIEYFYPGEGGKIWVDIFVDNPGGSDIKLKALHAGSLTARDVTDDSWRREHAEKDHCAGVLTKRIMALHDEKFCPIRVDYTENFVLLDHDQYRVWSGTVDKLIGDEPSSDVPFTLWEIKPFGRGKSVLRLCLEMSKETYDQRFANKRSFFLHGEAIVLRNIEDGDLSCNTTPSVERFKQEFANFKQTHKSPEAFEYLIVSPDGTDLLWDAVALSTQMSPRFIPSCRLARTTRWFTTDTSDVAELKADVLQIAKVDDQQSSVIEANRALIAQ